MKTVTLRFALFALVMGGFSIQFASAEVKLTARGCSSYAAWSRDLVWAKGIGADEEKARKELSTLLERSSDVEDRGVYTLLLRDLPLLWGTNAPFELVGFMRHQECLMRKGRYESPQ